MDVSKQFMKGWLSAFWDGEGSVRFRKTTAGKNHTSYYLTVSNTDDELLKTCQAFLTALGIEWTMWKYRTRPGCKQIGTLNIAKASSILKFAKDIKLYSPTKAGTLLAIINWIKRRRTKYNPNELRYLYWNKQMSLRQIVKYYGLRPGAHSRMSQLFRRLDIPTRKP